jgi:hypothetical protein
MLAIVFEETDRLDRLERAGLVVAAPTRRTVAAN